MSGWVCPVPFCTETGGHSHAPTDDRGAVALIGVVNRLALGSDICAMPVADLAAAILGERGRFLPDGTELKWLRDEWTRHHEVEAAARDVESIVGMYSETMDTGPDMAALRAALESEG